MFERISNGFAMARSSWRVIMSDKKLLLFPVVSGILFLIVTASFLIPMGILANQGKLEDGKGNLQVWVYPVIFALYFCTYFVIIFCNAALVSCALVRFNGGTPSVGDGFRAAMARLPQIAAWAFVSATVGLLLKVIENAGEKVGQIVSSILGTAWSVMTFFVVPILVVEKVGPIDSVSRSVSLMKKTWGEALTGHIGIGLFLFLLAIPIVLLLVAGFVLLDKMQGVGIALIVAGGISMLLYMAVSAAMNTVFMTAVYQYASTDRVPDGFDHEKLSHAFGAK
ncbi:MAG: DUF6159 family protein [Planctomycetes bacterium]|nr:DUF6159 family protein [Planctomycetota bacterium]